MTSPGSFGATYTGLWSRRRHAGPPSPRGMDALTHARHLSAHLCCTGDAEALLRVQSFRSQILCKPSGKACTGQDKAQDRAGSF